METAFSAYSDGITTLEHEVATLKSKLDSTTQVNERLHLTVKDMGSHSQQQNLRVLSIPEGLEGNDAHFFMMTQFKKSHEWDSNLELDRVHHSLDLKPPQGFRLFIIHFHRCRKEKVLQWAKKMRAAFNKIKALL